MITLAAKLKETRIRQGRTIDEVSSNTRIRSEFIRLIERGRYDQLPSQTYATGFVKNYIEYLGLPVKENMAKFRREFDESMSIKVLPDNYSNGRITSTFRIHHRLILVVGIVLSIILLVAYQFRYFVIAPPLSVEAPNENEKITENQVVVTGKTDPNAILSIEDQNVILDSSGRFNKTIRVFEGENTINIVSKHPYGKTAEIDRIIFVEYN